MMRSHRRSVLITVPAGILFGIGTTRSARASSMRQIDLDADRALRQLYATQVKARSLATRARALLIFPKIVKAGLLIGGQGGDGVLRVGGRPAGYYNIAAASFGLQAGVQTFSYALFFMTDASLKYLQDSDGWSIGSGPSVVVVDKGVAASMTSTTVTQDVYAFPFGQRGLMAGLGLEGSKITRINPNAGTARRAAPSLRSWARHARQPGEWKDEGSECPAGVGRRRRAVWPGACAGDRWALCGRWGRHQFDAAGNVRGGAAIPVGEHAF